MTNQSQAERPKVGVGVVVRKDGKILLGKRKGSHGAGTWNFPGGHLEFGETIDDCARRETREETGIEITNLIHGPFTNDYNETEHNHYVTLFIVTDYESGQVQTMEPEKCEGWDWYSLDNLPSPLFLPTQHFFESGFDIFA